MSDQQLHLFGGKGGAGKTTLAASYALTLSEQAPKQAVLLASADPNEALTDLFKKKIGGKPVKLVPGKGEGGLFAVQLDGKALFKTQLAAVAPLLKAAAQKGTVLSADDVGAL